MLNVSSDAIQLLANTTSNTFDSLAIVIAYMIAIPLAFYVFKRLIGFIPR